MSSDNLRVRDWTGDGYGELTTYPKYAKYRMEPNFPGATGDKQHTMVVYERDESAENGERELGRHDMGTSLVAFAGQPDPTPSTEVDPAEGANSGAAKTRSTTKTDSKK